jgi:flagellin-like protein
MLIKMKGGYIMLDQKQGLSGIVTTIIIIGIALVAVGVVWYTLSTVVDEQRQNIENSSEQLYQSCFEAGYSKMDSDNSSADDCTGSIKYIGGERCCDGVLG